jgi:hypothetical protein
MQMPAAGAAQAFRRGFAVLHLSHRTESQLVPENPDVFRDASKNDPYVTAKLARDSHDFPEVAPTTEPDCSVGMAKGRSQ